MTHPSYESDKPAAPQPKVDPTVLSVSGPLIRVHRSLEFKKAAVQLVYAKGSITAAGRELGVPFSTLHKWVVVDRQERTSRIPKSPGGSAEQLEIMRLRAALAKVTIERDMLKRATAFFAQLSS